MHENVVGWNIEPLTQDGYFVYEGVVPEKSLVVKPDHIVIVDVMTEVFVTDIFLGSITGSTYPAKHVAK
jgi:hypothetical protein